MFEKRIMKESNGFWEVQTRILPVRWWEPLDGWNTVFITRIYENARKRLELEPGTEVPCQD